MLSKELIILLAKLEKLKRILLFQKVWKTCVLKMSLIENVFYQIFQKMEFAFGSPVPSKNMIPAMAFCSCLCSDFRSNSLRVTWLLTLLRQVIKYSGCTNKLKHLLNYQENYLEWCSLLNYVSVMMLQCKETKEAWKFHKGS